MAMNALTITSQLIRKTAHDEFFDFGVLVSKISYLVTQQLQMQEEKSHRSESAIHSKPKNPLIMSRALSSDRLSKQTQDPEILEHIQKARDKLINIVPASRGVHGPTFLVDYSEYGQPFSCVLKWTNWEELRAQRVYQKIVLMIGYDHFSVPDSTMYDGLSGYYLDLNGQHKIFEDSENIKGSLDQILTFGKKRICQGDQVMLSSKVLGSTLSDFLATKYSFLTLEQKSNFMVQLGELALLDIFLGNYDRLFHYEMQKGENLNFGANLGNVMIDEDNVLKFHLIDNQINDSDPFSFRKFAEDLIKDRDQILNKMAADLQTSILSSCNMEEVPCIKGAIQSLRDDLHQIQPWLFIGLSQMEQMIRETICKKWLSKNNYTTLEEKIVSKRAKIFLNPTLQPKRFVPKCLQNPSREG